MLFIIGYLLGGFIGVGFVMLKHRIEDQHKEKTYDRGFLDGVQSVR